LSFNEVEGDTHNLYQQEFLNSTAQESIPPHIFKVKKGAPLMLLRNIDPRYDMCNGTQLLCRGLFKNMLDVKILTGSNAGKRAFLAIINIKIDTSSWFSFVLSRKQSPVRLSFAITINMSQGQTILNVRIYLSTTCSQPWSIICSFIKRSFSKFNKSSHYRMKNRRRRWRLYEKCSF